MAIKVTQTRYGTRYLALYRTVGGAQKSAGTYSDRREAEAAYMEAKAKVLRGIDPSLPVATVYPGQVSGQETVSSFSERWLPKHNVSHNVRLTYGYALKGHIIPVIGARPMADIGTPEIAQLLRDIDKLDRPALTAKVKAVMSAMFQAAAEDKTTGVKVNPVRGIKTKRHPRKRRIAFTHEEADKLRIEIPERYHLLIEFILGTGLRWEEAMGLKKENVINGTVYVGNTLHELVKPHRWEYRQSTKTGKSRDVKLTPALAARIDDCPDGYLFLEPDGSHIRGDRFRRYVWKPALKAIGLDGSGLVPRDLRRTHATWLLQNGVPIEYISKRLGHSSIITTQLYLHIVPDSEDAVVAAIDW